MTSAAGMAMLQADGSRPWHERWRGFVPPTLFVVGFMVVLDLLRRASGVSTETFPTTWSVIRAYVGLFSDGSFWTMVGETLTAWIVALLLAVLIGVPLGFAMGANRQVRALLTVPVEFLRPIPSVAMIPLAVVLWGAGLQSKLFLAVFASTWPLLYQARYAAGSVDSVLRQTSRMYGLGRRGYLRHVVMPSIAPFLATGIRLAASIALILTLTAEMLIGGGGLGGGIELARIGLDQPTLYALIIVTGQVGWLMSAALAQGERRALFWHPSFRPAAP